MQTSSLSALPPCASFWVKPKQCSHFVWVALCFVCLTMSDKGTSLSPPGPLSSRAPAVAYPGSRSPSTLSTCLPAQAWTCCLSVLGRALTSRWLRVISRIRPCRAAPLRVMASCTEHLAQGWGPSWVPCWGTAHSVFQPFILLFNFFFNMYLFGCTRS